MRSSFGFEFKRVDLNLEKLLGERLEEIKKKEEGIKRGLRYNLDIMLIEKIYKKEVFYDYFPYSFHLSLRRFKLNILRAGAVIGLIETKEGFLITEQSKEKDEREKGFFPSFGGLIDSSMESLEDAALTEMEEELGIEREEIYDFKYVGIFETSRAYVFSFYLKTDLGIEEIEERHKKAKDAWEIERILFVKNKKEIGESPLLNIYLKEGIIR